MTLKATLGVNCQHNTINPSLKLMRELWLCCRLTHRTDCTNNPTARTAHVTWRYIAYEKQPRVRWTPCKTISLFIFCPHSPLLYLLLVLVFILYYITYSLPLSLLSFPFLQPYHCNFLFYCGINKGLSYLILSFSLVFLSRGETLIFTTAPSFVPLPRCIRVSYIRVT